MSSIKYRNSANDTWQELQVIVGPQGPQGPAGSTYTAGTGITISNNNEISVDTTELSYNDLQDKPIIPTVPTNVSAFNNDAGYLTAHQDISGKANSADLATVATSGSYNDLTDKPTIPIVPTNVSDFTNDAGYLTQHQSLVGYATQLYVDNAIGNIPAPTTYTAGTGIDITNGVISLNLANVNGVSY